MEIEPYQRRQENKFVHLTRPSCSKFKILASSSFVEKIQKYIFFQKTNLKTTHTETYTTPNVRYGFG